MSIQRQDIILLLTAAGDRPYVDVARQCHGEPALLGNIDKNIQDLCSSTLVYDVIEAIKYEEAIAGSHDRSSAVSSAATLHAAY
ncbi:hypothetical protein RRG08_020050 [Elysia crispata]|uniref:Uncharacterized protein n=1 Tax=Elysia crispata TaxID=231223 RepID=A0AAE0XT94_9GAST|nr:hypothetical protein RRG08_010878 [Elysia crispata]KAK3795802.1 hypothetical protein RRG08_020050 [Elysia crispata]